MPLTEHQQRWVGFACGIWCCLCAGTQYAVSSYSDDLKNDLGWSQTDLNVVLAAGNWGLYLSGIWIGWIYDTYGPRATLTFGGASLFLGYLLMWLAVDGNLTSSAGAAAFFYVLIGNGSAGGQVGTLTPMLKWFPPAARGLVVAAMLSAFGLSSLVVTQIYSAFFDGDLPGFLLFLAALGLASGVVGVLGVKDAPPQPVVVAEPSESVNLLANPAGGAQKRVPIEHTYGILRVVCDPVFVLLYTLFMLGAGCGLLFINSLGSIVTSLGLAEGKSDSAIQDRKNLLVSILAVANVAGRLLIGSLSDKLRAKCPELPRGVWGIFSLFWFCLAYGLLAFFGVGFDDLVFPTVAVGLAYGSLFVVVTAMLSELFGLERMGVNYGVTITAAAVGSQILGVIFGVLYDQEKDRQGDADDCVGDECHTMTMQIAFGSALGALGINALLVLLSRRRLLRDSA